MLGWQWGIHVEGNLSIILMCRGQSLNEHTTHFTWFQFQLKTANCNIIVLFLGLIKWQNEGYNSNLSIYPVSVLSVHLFLYMFWSAEFRTHNIVITVKLKLHSKLKATINDNPTNWEEKFPQPACYHFFTFDWKWNRSTLYYICNLLITIFYYNWLFHFLIVKMSEVPCSSGR